MQQGRVESARTQYTLYHINIFWPSFYFLAQTEKPLYPQMEPFLHLNPPCYSKMKILNKPTPPGLFSPVNFWGPICQRQKHWEKAWEHQHPQSRQGDWLGRWGQWGGGQGHRTQKIPGVARTGDICQPAQIWNVFHSSMTHGEICITYKWRKWQ